MPRRLLSRGLAVVRLFIIYDLVDGLGDRSLDVLEEHIKRITLPEDNNFIPKSRALRVQANLASQESEDACPSGLGLPVAGSCQRYSLGGAGFVKADAWRCMDWSSSIGKQRAGQPFGASARLSPLQALGCPAVPGWRSSGRPCFNLADGRGYLGPD